MSFHVDQKIIPNKRKLNIDLGWNYLTKKNKKAEWYKRHLHSYVENILAEKRARQKFSGHYTKRFDLIGTIDKNQVLQRVV